MVPTALIFTSVQSVLIFKLLALVDPDKLSYLGVDFSLQSEEELCAVEQIPILSTLINLNSISLTYNYLKGREKEVNLMNTLRSLPRLYKLNLSGNTLKENTHCYATATLRDLVLGNVYPSADSLRRIGQVCGGTLTHLKLSDNGLNTRLHGLEDLLLQCRALVSLDLSGNHLSTERETKRVLDALEGVESTLQSLTLEHNMFREGERMSIVQVMSRFASLTELFLVG